MKKVFSKKNLYFYLIFVLIIFSIFFILLSEQISAITTCTQVSPTHDGTIYNESAPLFVSSSASTLIVRRYPSDSGNYDTRSYIRFNFSGSSPYGYPSIPEQASLNITVNSDSTTGAKCPELYKINDYMVDSSFDTNDYWHPSDEIFITTLPCSLPVVPQRLLISIPPSYINPKAPNAFMIRGGIVGSADFIDMEYSSTETTTEIPPKMALCTGGVDATTTSPKLIFKDGTTNIAAIGNNGNMTLLGELFVRGTSFPAATSGDFVLKNSLGTPVVVLQKSTYNLYIKGDLYHYQSQSVLSSFIGGPSDFIIKNTAGFPIAVFTNTGNLYLFGMLDEHVLAV